MNPTQILYRKCGRCAAKLFPYNSNDQILGHWCLKNVKTKFPEKLMLDRSPNINSVINKDQLNLITTNYGFTKMNTAAYVEVCKRQLTN